jgi:membrane-associated phospholipid phosphatase
MKRYYLLVFCFWAVSASAGGAPGLSLTDKKPFEISMKKDRWLLGAGIAAAGAAFVLERSIPALRQEEIDGLVRGSVNPFDRHATYHYSKNLDNISDFLVYGILAAPLALFTDRDIRRNAAEFSLMYAEVVAFSYALPTLGKAFIKRPRPFDYNPDAPKNEKLLADARASFFSRHTTFAFASACFMSTVYGKYNHESRLKPYLWAGSLAAAAVVGDLRFEAGAHFMSDVLIGAAVGSVVGCGVPLLHNAKKAGLRLSLLPVPDGFRLSLELSRKYR